MRITTCSSSFPLMCVTFSAFWLRYDRLDELQYALAAESRHSLHRSHTQKMDVDEGSGLNEPRLEETCFLGFRPREIQTS